MGDSIFAEKVDMAVIKEFNHFLLKVNQRSCIKEGWIDEEYVGADMDGNIIPALGFDVEYFHPVITMDDRMRYIAENIVTLPDDKLCEHNKICNTIISHFYGARGIHQTLSGIKEPKEANLDFKSISDGDIEYTKHIQKNAKIAKSNGVPLWGTTELHTSIQTAGRNFCRLKYDDKTRPLHPADVAEWVASFISDGTTQKLLDAKGLKSAYDILTTHRGIGEYYGYHCSTSNSVNPGLNWDNDDEFVVPGPGARASVAIIFPGLDKKKYGEAIIWIRKNQKTLFPDLEFHEEMAHIVVGEANIFTCGQNELKCYGTEVACCQFHVYQHLKANPHLAKKRKVARIEDDSVCDAATLHGLLW